jgi:hypothetical protein
MSEENLGGSSVTVGRLVRVSDANIKDCSLATGPEAMDGKIATKFRGRFSAVGSVQSYVSTGLDEWFVGNGGWIVGLTAKLSPSSYKVIVTMED